MCYVPDVFATGAALLEEAKSRAPPPRDAISTAERPWARCAELRRRPGSTRWPTGPRRRGPEGRTRAGASEGAGRRETPSRQPNGHGAGATASADGPARRAGRRARDGEVRRAVPAPEPRKAPAGSSVVRCCSTSRVVASQDVCEVARGAGRVEKYTDTDGRVWDAAAHYIFSCRAGAECFARQKGCSAQLARTSNARRAAPMCKFCRRQQLATNLAGPARRTVSARRTRCGCGRGFLSPSPTGPTSSRRSLRRVRPVLAAGRASFRQRRGGF